MGKKNEIFFSRFQVNIWIIRSSFVEIILLQKRQTLRRFHQINPLLPKYISLFPKIDAVASKDKKKNWTNLQKKKKKQGKVLRYYFSFYYNVSKRCPLQNVVLFYMPEQSKSWIAAAKTFYPDRSYPIQLKWRITGLIC